MQRHRFAGLMGDRFRFNNILLKLVNNLLINSEIAHLQVNGMYTFIVNIKQQKKKHILPRQYTLACNTHTNIAIGIRKQCNNKIHLIQQKLLFSLPK